MPLLSKSIVPRRRSDRAMSRSFAGSGKSSTRWDSITCTGWTGILTIRRSRESFSGWFIISRLGSPRRPLMQCHIRFRFFCACLNYCRRAGTANPLEAASKNRESTGLVFGPVRAQSSCVHGERISRQCRSNHGLPVVGRNLFLCRRKSITQRDVSCLSVRNQNHSAVFSSGVFLLLVEPRSKSRAEVRRRIRSLVPRGLVGSTDWFAVLLFRKRSWL